MMGLLEIFHRLQNCIMLYIMRIFIIILVSSVILMNSVILTCSGRGGEDDQVPGGDAHQGDGATPGEWKRGQVGR